DPPLEKSSLHRIPRQPDCRGKMLARVGGVSPLELELGEGGVVEVIGGETREIVELADCREARRRAVELTDRDRPVERDDGRWLQRHELIVPEADGSPSVF